MNNAQNSLLKWSTEPQAHPSRSPSQECNNPQLALEIISTKLAELEYHIETSIAYQEMPQSSCPV
jgi:hypothetical protein